MVFSSITFVSIFLPTVLILSLLFHNIRIQNGILLAASLLFYAYGEPVYIFLLIGSCLFYYVMARILEKRRSRGVMALAVAASLATLTVFKYLGLLISIWNQILPWQLTDPQIVLPIGISFFTFQELSYLIDVYRGETKAQKNPVKLMLYVCLFPQLIAGPIVKYHEIEKEIDNRSRSMEDIAWGIRRFIVGLCKKVLLANTLGQAVDGILAGGISGMNILSAWLCAVSYMLQIYYDFSGYSDMAIGMGQMFGFHFRENFQYPYCAGSIREFWRRWHISLSTWFRDYLYIPLGGNRKGFARTLWNRFFVFLCTGIWHGANLTFLFWGMYHGCFVLLETVLEKRSGSEKKGSSGIRRAVSHLYALLVVCVGVVMFRADTISEAFAWIGQMFTGYHFEKSSMCLLVSQLNPAFLIILTLSLFLLFPQRKWMQENEVYRKAAWIGSLAGYLLCMMQLAAGTYNPFIYFHF